MSLGINVKRSRSTLPAKKSKSLRFRASSQSGLPLNPGFLSIRASSQLVKQPVYHVSYRAVSTQSGFLYALNAIVLSFCADFMRREVWCFRHLGSGGLRRNVDIPTLLQGDKV